MSGQQGNRFICACGSGLSRARCCELNLNSLGSPEASRHLIPLEEQAQLALKSGDKPTAERLALDVLELAPGRIPCLGMLYDLRKAEGGKRQAQEALIRRIVSLDPNNFWATNEITVLLLENGNVAEAEKHARNAIRIAPENAQSHNLMGMVLTEAHRPAFGEYHYRRALEIARQRDPVVLSNLALCLKNQGKMQEARDLYEEALIAQPRNLHTLLGFARLLEADRKLDEAMALLDRAEADYPKNPSIALLRAVVLGRMRDAPAALAVLDKMAADGKGQLGPSELLEKGRLLDQMGRYDEAFEAYIEGKKRLREISGHQYLAEFAAQSAARRRGFFTARRLSLLPVARVRRDVAQPIFIVGFPRSGTTLLEQTLTAHPTIAAGDELPIIAELTNLMPRMMESPLSFPESLAELWMADHRDDLDNLRDHYLRRVAQLGIVAEGAKWFTDKMPLNEVDLGLISLLFPESPILHQIRHPLDVVTSVFSNLLTHGHYCAYALESVARHYALTMELVEHYQRELNMRYLQVRYEDMVDQQDSTVRKVLDFVGAEFDPACLAFHENTRYARTASYAQVTEKLYDRSRYRHRHYMKYLRDILPILQPTIDRLGYPV